MRSEILDADSDTIVVDNLANCVIWKHRYNFVQSMYTKLEQSSTLHIFIAVGLGSSVDMGDLRIGWYYDDGRYHDFMLKTAFYIP